MKRIQRGTFLRTAAMGAAATLNFLYPGVTGAAWTARSGHRPLATAVPPPPGVVVKRMDGPDPSVAGGEVVAKTADGVIVQSHAAVRAIRIDAGTSVWKEFDVTPDVIQLSDWLDVKGTPLTDGSLQAQWIFVNIGRRGGVVGQVVSPTSLNVRNGQSTYTMELSSRLEVISAEDGSLLPGGLARLTPGTPFGAVGLRLPNYGFRATRIWI